MTTIIIQEKRDCKALNVPKGTILVLENIENEEVKARLDKAHKALTRSVSPKKEDSLTVQALEGTSYKRFSRRMRMH